MRKSLACFLAFLLVLWPAPAAWAQSGGNCSIFRSWLTGNSLTASDLTSSFTTVGVTNVTQACVDGISDTVAGMQTTTDPFPSQTESLATSGAGELQRLRFMIQRMFGLQDWYRHDSNVNFAHAGGGVNVQGAGLGRHVTAVGLHVWSGFRQGAPRPGQFPSITSVDDHWTGLAFPAVGHVSVVVGNPLNGLVQGGVEAARWHAQAVTLHHAVALRFAHSTAQMDGGQRGHITALQVSRGEAGDEAIGRDTLLIGHAGTVLQMVGYGASHIALGNRAYVALGAHRGTLPSTPVANALYASLMPRAWGRVDGTATDAGVQEGFNIASVQRVDTGQYLVTWERGFTTATYGVWVTGGVATFATVESITGAHAVVRTWSLTALFTPVNGVVNVLAIGTQ